MSPDESADSRSRVLPLVSDAGNRQLLVEWLDDHPSYEPVELADGLAEADFDVCILDSGAFHEHLDALSAKKSATEPVLLPYLLLLPDGKSDVIDTDAGQLADNVVTESVDEIVTLPIQQTELQWRLSALLRLREQSMTLRNRERKLERQVDLFEKAQDIANVGAWEYDIDDEEGWWTDAVYRIHGLSEDATPSPESSLQQFHPDDRPAVRAAFETAVEEGESYDVEARLATGDDETRWVRTRGEPQYEDGELVRVRGTIQDITERKERERDLQRIEQAVESAGHAIYITDPEGVIEYVNPAFEAATGFAEAEVVGETPHVLTSGEMSDEYYADLWSTLRAGEVWEEEIVNRRKNGETYTAMQTIAPVTDGDDVHAFVAIHDDITERKQREERLTRRTEAVEEAPVGISISDPGQEDNPLIYVNDTFVEMTGYSREEILGSNCRFLQGDATDPDRVASIRAAIDDEEPVSVDLRNYRKDGTEFWNHLEVAPVENEDGDVVNWVGFQQDVTERKQRQEQLSVLDRVLRHNLRNDMNIIRGLAETIRSEATGEVEDFAARIVEKSDRLVELTEKERHITALLQEDPEHEQFAVGDRLRAVASTVASKHPEASIDVDCADGITVDATTRFEQAINELVTNAVVHSDSASPAVTVSATQTADAVRIEVADDGPEIPEMERGLLTGQTEETPLYHGSGLGLWLVKLIVSRSHGTITVEANTPTGNVVSITLPR
jgi:PAS domain S-box-containing protein